jgi:hypothetical protein
MHELTTRLLRVAVLAAVVLVPSTTRVFADPIVSIQPLASTEETGSFFNLEPCRERTPFRSLLKAIVLEIKHGRLDEERCGERSLPKFEISSRLLSYRK